MFNNNISQTYNLQDASQEIVIMLLGAFLLGCLLTWLFNKLFNKDYKLEKNIYRYKHQSNDEINTLTQTQIPQANTTNEARIVEKPTNPSETTLIPDDLTKIRGIDEQIQSNLLEFNVVSFTDLRDIKTKDLLAFKRKQPSLEKEIETWPHQASLAAKGEWNKLEDYQGFIQRVQVASSNSKKPKPEGADDLTQLVGINSEIENILNKKGIYTFKQLSHSDNDILKKDIVNADLHFDETETESWPHQAAMAEKGQWEELKIYQGFMHSDNDVSTINDSIKPKSNITRKNSEGLTLVKTSDKTEVKTNLIKPKVTLEKNLSDHDDLKKVEGIGPKIEEVLNKGGIYTFIQLYNSDKDRLRQLLDDAGSQFKMHDPESWPHQAGMANHNEWEELKTYQSSINKDKNKLLVEKNNKVSAKDKKTNKLTIAHPKDDFTKIEGIGPKIQEVLNNAGIYSFKRLSQSSPDSIKVLLNDAGPQFRMHEPETWPKQANLASRSKWKELETYQDTITQEQALKANNETTDSKLTGNNQKNIKSKKTGNDTQKDDLRKIEGIGPKISDLLNNAGIHSFEQLSGHSRDFIKEILNEAGPQFRMHEPESWPHQANLAAKGDWDELEKYQDFLIAGRE